MSTPVKVTLCAFLLKGVQKPQPTSIQPPNSGRCTVVHRIHIPVPYIYVYPCSLPVESSGHPHRGLDREGFGVSFPSILLVPYSEIIEVPFPFLLRLRPAVLRTVLLLLLLLLLHLTRSAAAHTQPAPVRGAGSAAISPRVPARPRRHPGSATGPAPGGGRLPSLPSRPDTRDHHRPRGSRGVRRPPAPCLRSQRRAAGSLLPRKQRLRFVFRAASGALSPSHRGVGGETGRPVGPALCVGVCLCSEGLE